jgi:hypothetical protein
MKENTTADGGELLTSDQIMDRLLALPWLRRRAATCVLPAVKCGHEWRFRSADLENWIAAQIAAEGPHQGAAPPSTRTRERSAS